MIWRASGGWGNLPSSENTKLSLVSRSSWDTRDAANVKTALADITDLRNPGWSQAQTIDDGSPQGDWPTPSSWVAMEVSTFQKLRKRLLWHFIPFLIFPHLWTPFFYIFGSIFTLLCFFFSFLFSLMDLPSFGFVTCYFVTLFVSPFLDIFFSFLSCVFLFYNLK